MKKITFRILCIDLLIFVLTLCIGLAVLEGILWIKNSNQRNYGIEIWRYGKLLTQPSDDPVLGHEHKKGKRAKLQNTDIVLNSLGMRGPEPELGDELRKRILFLGSSQMLGWGVPESQTMFGLLRSMMRRRNQLFNAGIANYNAVRYVRLFEKRYRSLKPDTVVILYTINDAEKIVPGKNNPLLRHSQVATLINYSLKALQRGSADMSKLTEHYREIYKEGSVHRREMETALKHIAQMAKEDGFNVIFAVVPDSHEFSPYPFAFVHEHMRQLIKTLGWTYVDFTSELAKVRASEYWNMPGDPHYNARGHYVMAQQLFAYLN